MATQTERDKFASAKREHDISFVYAVYAVFLCVLSVATIAMDKYRHVFVAVGMTEACLSSIRSAINIFLLAALSGVTVGGLVASILGVVIFRSDPNKRGIVNLVGITVSTLVFAAVCGVFYDGSSVLALFATPSNVTFC